MAIARELPDWDKFVEWQKGLEELLKEQPRIMTPIQNALPEDPEAEEQHEEDEVEEGEVLTE